MRTYWASTPTVARAAIGLGLATAIFVALFWTAFFLTAPEGSDPLPGVVLGGIVTEGVVLTLSGVIVRGLRSDSAASNRMAAALGGLAALPGIGWSLIVVTAPKQAHLTTSDYLIGLAAGLIALAYLTLAWIGFRRSGRPTQPAGPLIYIQVGPAQHPVPGSVAVRMAVTSKSRVAGATA